MPTAHFWGAPLRLYPGSVPPLQYSRYSFSKAITDEAGRLYLTEAEPFGYLDLPDNRLHTVIQGDTLWSIAERYFESFDDPSFLWWVIADFQPDPIHDPTIALMPGRLLYIPSVRTINERIFNPSRAQT